MKKVILLLAFCTSFFFSAYAQKQLKVGEKAPLFVAKNQNGATIDLKKVLKEHKYVVLFFYRGQWCPYCNKHIKELQDSLQLLTAKDAFVIGVTPETNENINKTMEKTKADFTIVQDNDDTIMKAYGVNFVLDEATFAKYKTYGIDLDKNNGNSRHSLPVPATFIINKAGLIKYVQFDTDYKKRASVKELLSEL